MNEKVLERVKSTRESFLAGDRKRDAGLRAPEDVVRFCDIPYGTTTVWQLMDIYRPKAAGERKLPVIVSIHGGGWVYGSKSIYQYYCMSLAQRGFAVVNFTYRLAPEYKFPAALEDTNLVMRFIFDHADEYGLDTENIFVVGDSAGGNYCGLYAEFVTNPAYAAEFEFKAPEGLRLNAVCLNCGLYRAREAAGRDQELFEALLADGCTEESLKSIDVPTHLTAAFPPAFIMSANEDFLLSEAPVMKELLDGLGVENEMKIYGTPEKPLSHVFHVNMRLQEAAVCNDDETAFFRAHMN